MTNKVLKPEYIEEIDKAARKGDVYFAMKLGDYFFKKDDQEENKKAVEYYELAVSFGHYDAFNKLAKCHELGKGFEKDSQKAFELYKLAEEKGAPSYYDLGCAYKYGLGTEVDYEKADEYFHKGSLAGDISCMHSSGYPGADFDFDNDDF